MKLEIRSFAVISTAHVRQITSEKLDQADYYDWQGPISGGPFSEYGWFMHCLERGHGSDRVPEELMAVFDYLNAKGIRYVLFDRDGPVVEDLPTWEW